ncbi:MAG: recombinase family protein [Megasphaera sp.]|jgi:DNA invertase Pin-like site-specific DNA recombinase|nr:recombinase family protein [Megasphaera sp.]
MKSKIYGYVRVSTKDQHIDRQWDALLKTGVQEENMYVDKQSGKNFERPHYRRLMKKIKKGDCIIVTSLDRLGRNYTEIQEQWRMITKEKHADIIVLDMPLLNTKVNHGNLMGQFLADMVLQILSYVAETERNNIRKRQAEGIAAAQSRGVHFGRSAIPVPNEFDHILYLWHCGAITSKEAAKRMNMSRSWFYKKRKYLDDDTTMEN